jgi:wobble nucleotide-excising tRNase
MRRVKNDSDVWDGFFIIGEKYVAAIARLRRRPSIARWNRNGRRRR